MSENRITDQKEYRLLLVGVLISIVTGMSSIIFGAMRDTDKDLLLEQRATQKAQQNILIEQARVVARLDGAIEEVRRANEAVKEVAKLTLQNQALALEASERSKHNTSLIKHNAERIRELRTN